ncbi:MAG: transposase, partial [Sedimentisphaerales bacterium]|nr:transposase [Sedimentisphaerales bacterium]
TQARIDTRAGHYQRKLQTQAGQVNLRVPKSPGGHQQTPGDEVIQSGSDRP